MLATEFNENATASQRNDGCRSAAPTDSFRTGRAAARDGWGVRIAVKVLPDILRASAQQQRVRHDGGDGQERRPATAAPAASRGSSISQAATGKKMVLARPAISVTIIMARVRWRSNQAVMTTNAGS